MPNIARTDLTPSHLHLTITLLREDLKPKLDSEFKRLKQRATIKGFRAGQAPAQYVKSLYGQSLFYDVFNKMMSDELSGFLKDNDLDVLGQPLPVEDGQRQYKFSIDNPEPEYSVVYEIGHVPKFELAGLSKDEIYDRYEVTDLDTLAAKDLEEARKSGGARINPEEDILEDDILKVEAKEMDGDSPKADGWETTITISVNEIVNPDLKAQVLTLKKGDHIRFDIQDLETNRDQDFIRKYLLSIPADDEREVGNIFGGEISEVSRMGVAELNEAFFQANFGENVKTESEAIEVIKNGVAQFYEQRANALVFREMQDRLLKLNNIELPDEFLKRWLRISNEGVVSQEEVDRDYDSFATSLRWSMVRDRIIERFGITVSEEEIREEFYRTLINYFRAQLPMEMLKGGVDRMMSDKKEVERVSSNIQYEKMFNAALTTVTTQPKAISSEEFHAIFDQAKQTTQG
jgi:trigger factor